MDLVSGDTDLEHVMASDAATSATRATARRRVEQEDKSSEQKGAAQERVLHLPDVHFPEVRVPSVHVPRPGGKTGRVLWWGTLGGLAAFGVVDWPVAVLVGAGSWVAEQYAKAGQRQGGGDRAEAR